MNLDERAKCWTEFKLATQDRRHPFRQPIVMSIDEEGYPSGRVLTLRHADPHLHTLRFHVDRRSPKFAQWERQPVAAAVFYDPAARWQLRVKGVTDLHYENEIAREAWENSHPMCWRTYLAKYAPGAEISDAESIFPEGLERRRPTLSESEPGYRNFAVLLVEVVEMDSLHLAGTGHSRYRINEEEFRVQRLAP